MLAFEAIDAADEATVETMAQILQRPGWLRLPLLFTMRGIPQGRVAELVYLLHRDEGEAAVMAIEDEATPAQEAVRLIGRCSPRTSSACCVPVLSSGRPSRQNSWRNCSRSL